MRVFFIFISVLLQFVLTGQVRLIKKDESCKGRNDGRIQVVVDGMDGPFIYQWSNGFTSNRIINLEPGDYSVTVSTEQGCMDVKHARIFPGSTVSVHISAKLWDVSPKPVPCGERPVFTYRLTAVPSGGTPPYYCSWGEGGNGAGGCVKNVSGTFLDETVVLTDSVGCVDSDGWSKRGAKKICSSDPNDITGPEGYSQDRWISVHDEMDFTVRFENDPLFATANASTVLITIPMDDDIDPFSFRLSTMGFGNKIIEVPENVASFQQRLDYSSDLGFMIDVTAGLDLPNQRYFWLFETIDPLTGQPPIDPTAGFLPVNDTLTGSGEGFVNFVCKPKSSTLTGEVASHQASIVFDANDPLLTNVYDNKIDAFPPVTSTTPLADTFYTNMIPFSWMTQDDSGGCGVQHSQIFLSTDGVQFESNGFVTDTTGTTLELGWGAWYYYRILASDNVNNREEGIVDSFYIIPQRAIEFVTPDQDNYCIGDTLKIDVILASIPDADLYMSIDSGSSYVPLATLVSEWPYEVVLDSAYIHPYLFIKARNNAANIERVSDRFTVKYLPVVDAGSPVAGCDNEILFVEATGANDYLWTPDSIIGTPEQRYSNVYANTSQYAYVRGTDVFGCSAVDSVYLTVHAHTVDTIIHPLCEGDSILIDGNWILEEGFYQETFGNLQGCDSIVVTDVQFENPCIWPGGQYVYVDQDAAGDNNGKSWVDAFNDLQDALYVAGRYENVQEIWIAEGVYNPHNSLRDTSFVLRDSIKVYGGFIGVEATRAERTGNPALVQLSGDINLPDTLTDNSFHTLQMLSSCQECIVDGLTITYGHADQVMNADDRGAGVLNFGQGHFINVVFERNYSSDIGAALYSTGSSASLIIENCTFRLNTSSLGRDVVNHNGAQLEFRGLNGIH